MWSLQYGQTNYVFIFHVLIFIELQRNPCILRNMTCLLFFYSCCWRKKREQLAWWYLWWWRAWWNLNSYHVLAILIHIWELSNELLFEVLCQGTSEELPEVKGQKFQKRPLLLVKIGEPNVWLLLFMEPIVIKLYAIAHLKSLISGRKGYGSTFIVQNTLMKSTYLMPYNRATKEQMHSQVIVGISNPANSI